MSGAQMASPLLTASIQYIINVVLTLPAVLFLDKWGRRPSLVVGSFLMMIWLFITGNPADCLCFVPLIEVITQCFSMPSNYFLIFHPWANHMFPYPLPFIGDGGLWRYSSFTQAPCSSIMANSTPHTQGHTITAILVGSSSGNGRLLQLL